MTTIYLVVGAAELGWRYSRMVVATGLGLVLASCAMGALMCQRYVAEVEDSCST